MNTHIEIVGERSMKKEENLQFGTNEEGKRKWKKETYGFKEVVTPLERASM